MYGTMNREQLMRHFACDLAERERAQGTIEKYLRDAGAFLNWLEERELTKLEVTRWKEGLREKGYAATSINAMIASVNAFLRSICREDCRVKALRIQRKLFRQDSREMTADEYKALLCAAYASGRERLGLILETIGSTGIRIGELRFITVEVIRRGQAEISLKGKIRTILLPEKLRKKLLRYAEKNKIRSGEIFLTRNGTSVSRKQIWAEMKALCTVTAVDPEKVFPHNLRHLFARTFYRMHRDIMRLADVLGHSNIETTRIYLITSCSNHARQISRLGLLL